MNLAQLRYFQRLARVRHYTRAANELFITQPTLSHAIATLSDELGCELVRREGREIVLTAEGEAFLAHVDRALSELDCGVEELKQREGMLSGRVEVGAVASVRSHFVPAAIRAFREEHGPYVTFDLFQGFTPDLASKFGEGLYDMVLCGPYNVPGTERRLLFYQEVALAVRRDCPLASKRFATLSDLAGYRVVTYRQNMPAGELATEFLNDHGAPLGKIDLMRNCDDEVTMATQVLDDGMVAMCIVNSNLPVNPDLCIVPLRVPGALDFYPIYVMYRKGGHVSPAAKAFIDFLVEFNGPDYERPDYASTVRI